MTGAMMVMVWSRREGRSSTSFVGWEGGMSFVIGRRRKTSVVISRRTRAMFAGRRALFSEINSFLVGHIIVRVQVCRFDILFS